MRQTPVAFTRSSDVLAPTSLTDIQFSYKLRKYNLISI